MHMFDVNTLGMEYFCYKGLLVNNADIQGNIDEVDICIDSFCENQYHLK